MPHESDETVAEFALAGREGANAARAGRSASECPYNSPETPLLRRAWVAGYVQARTEIRTSTDPLSASNVAAPPGDPTSGARR